MVAQPAPTPQVFRARLPGNNARTPANHSQLPVSSQRVSVGRPPGTGLASHPMVAPASRHSLRASTGNMAGGGIAGGMTSGIRVGTANRSNLNDNAVNYASLARPQSYPARYGARVGTGEQAYISGGLGVEAQQQQTFSARHGGRYFQ